MKPEKPPSSSSKQENIQKRLAPLFEEGQITDKIDSLTLGDQSAALEVFREQWKQELTKPSKEEEALQEKKKEEEARNLFLQGVECEKRGEMSEAVHKYTRAVKLVPDIERKVDGQVAPPRARSTSRVRGSSNVRVAEGENSLTTVFQKRLSQRGPLFQGPGDGSLCQLNRLPVELLNMILHASIGSDVNLHLLETLSEVSTGFYLLARNNELWKQLHSRSLGVSQPCDHDPVINWREFYLSYPHLRFDGVYLSKITYLRHGDTGFQDNNYRPWHTVVYYRLTRFFSNGSVLMTTSTDTPQNAVNLLKNQSPSRNDTTISVGTWRQEEDKVYLELCREYVQQSKPKYSRQKKAPTVDYGVLRHIFRIIFKLCPMKVPGKWCLQWIENKYTVTYFDGRTQTSDMEVDKNAQNFPPLRFYRVKL